MATKATKVLRPHDVLTAQPMRRIPAFLAAGKPKKNPNPKPSRKTPSPRPEGRKRREGSAKPAKTGGGKRLAALQVTGRPDPEMGPKQISAAAEVYAGSAFWVSPSPSSLPLPNFSVKEVPAIVDYATHNLRRLLRLE